MLDGVDLRVTTVDSYRGLLGIVEQDIFLFDGTIAENIGYARRRDQRLTIIQACQNSPSSAGSSPSSLMDTTQSSASCGVETLRRANCQRPN